MYDQLLALLGRDKVQHFAFGAVFAVMGAAIANAFQVGLGFTMLAALVVALAVGIAKEMMDNWANEDQLDRDLPPLHDVDPWDAVATALGGAYVAAAFMVAHWVASLP